MQLICTLNGLLMMLLALLMEKKKTSQGMSAVNGIPLAEAHLLGR